MECKKVHPLWKTAAQSLRKKKITMTQDRYRYDSLIPLQYPKEIKTGPQTLLIFKPLSFTVAKKKKKERFCGFLRLRKAQLPPS